MDALVDSVMTNVTGSVRMKLYKGSAAAVSRVADISLYRTDLATFRESATYDHADAEGFIRLFGLPLRVAAAASRSAATEKSTSSYGGEPGIPDSAAPPPERISAPLSHSSNGREHAALRPARRGTPAGAD